MVVAMASSAPAAENVEPVTQSCEGTSSKISSSSPKVKRKPGRPSKASRCEPPVVTIEGRRDVLLTTGDEFKHQNVVLFVSNRLLYEWHEICLIQWIIYLF